MNKKQLLRAGLFALSLGLSLSGLSHADCGGSDGSDCSQDGDYGQFVESWIQEEPFNEFAGLEAQTVEVAEKMDPGPSEELASAGWGDFEPTAAAQPAQAYEVTENLTNGMTQVDGVEPTEAVMNAPGQTPNMTIVTSNVPDSGAGPLPSAPQPTVTMATVDILNGNRTPQDPFAAGGQFEGCGQSIGNGNDGCPEILAGTVAPLNPVYGGMSGIWAELASLGKLNANGPIYGAIWTELVQAGATAEQAGLSVMLAIQQQSPEFFATSWPNWP